MDRPSPGHGDAEALAELRERVASLEADLRTEEIRSAADRRRLEQQLARAAALVRDRERDMATAAADAARFRRRRAVRLAVTASGKFRPQIAAVLSVYRPIGRGRRWFARHLKRGTAAPRSSAAHSERDAERAVVAGLPPVPTADGRVTIIVESRNHPAALRDCLAGLSTTAWSDLDIIVAGPEADNRLRAATDGNQRTSGGRRWVRPVTGMSATDSRREALAVSTSELVLFLHDDVRPLEPGWLARMVATLRAENAAVVGARLLVPASDAGSGDTARIRIGHLGLEYVPVDGMPTPRPIGFGEDVSMAQAAVTAERPAVSEACLLVRRSVLDEVGVPASGTDEAEPVDLCLRIRAAGHRIVVDGSAVLWHRGQLREIAAQPTRVPFAEREDRWGPALWRAVFLDRLRGTGRWSSRPLRVGITLSRDDELAGFGDWYTAHELGGALGGLGLTVVYLERHEDRWYEAAGECDVIVSLLERFDLFRIPRHVVTVAWIRNWTEEWAAKPWFANYDIVLVSSQRSKEIVEERTAKSAHVFPIATNPERFHPVPVEPDLATDAVFVGSHWGADRGVAVALPILAKAGLRVRVHGRGWEDQPEMADLADGLLPYERIPAVYASSAIAIDDAAVSTKPYGSVNSRVFDALATGTIVVSDNTIGVRELFGDRFPTWDRPEDLVRVVEGLLADPVGREELARTFREEVLARHTYAHRAVRLREILEAWASSTRIAVHIGPLTWQRGATWGDVPFGRDLQRNLERRGHPTAVLVSMEQETAAAARADIAIHVFGVRAARTMGGQVNALWVISHPDRVTASLCDAYDAVFVASDSLSTSLAERVSPPVFRLHQATEPQRFYPDPTGPHHQLLFVANSRGVRRPIVDDLRGAPWDLAVYGGGWTAELLDERHLRGTWVDNDRLRSFYSSADVVLNDHWSDMRESGLISNRVYDAAACGAFVVSDRVAGIDEEFDGAVATYETREELHALLRRYLDDPVARRAVADRGRAAVLARHTFAQRAAAILDVVLPMASERRDGTSLDL